MRRHQILLLSSLLTASTVSFADNSKTISRILDVDDVDLVHIEFPVGELEVVIWDELGISLEVEVFMEPDSSFELRDQITLTPEVDGSDLLLVIDEKDLELHWVVKVPESLALEIELGVGEIRIDGLDNNLSVELGVGEIEVIAATANFDHIDASVGVGDATLQGFGSGTENERSFGSRDAHYEGGGDYAIEVELGVGDALVRLD